MGLFDALKRIFGVSTSPSQSDGPLVESRPLDETPTPTAKARPTSKGSGKPTGPEAIGKVDAKCPNCDHMLNVNCFSRRIDSSKLLL
ncbi:MAG: hypothetical protein QME66_12720, partial [Candidatus Eisenbacteria bacterium]|nr:hypothetical protein [Candidatus Eisenbacteria bacterium]